MKNRKKYSSPDTSWEQATGLARLCDDSFDGTQNDDFDDSEFEW